MSSSPLNPESSFEDSKIPRYNYDELVALHRGGHASYHKNHKKLYTFIGILLLTGVILIQLPIRNLFQVKTNSDSTIVPVEKGNSTNPAMVPNDKTNVIPTKEEKQSSFDGKEERKFPNSKKSAIRYINQSVVYFIFRTKELTPKAKLELDDIAKVLVKYPSLVVRIDGHTCFTGEVEENFELSRERARVVKEYLISKGVDSELLSTRGKGEYEEVASNYTSEGRKKNRRVEFSVLGFR
jgi:outer membrane protein OmpA-like peptidoglycan-associated protein